MFIEFYGSEFNFACHHLFMFHINKEILEDCYVSQVAPMSIVVLVSLDGQIQIKI